MQIYLTAAGLALASCLPSLPSGASQGNSCFLVLITTQTLLTAYIIPRTDRLPLEPQHRNQIQPPRLTYLLYVRLPKTIHEVRLLTAGFFYAIFFFLLKNTTSN